MPNWNHSTDWHLREDNFSDRGSAFPSTVNCVNATDMLEWRNATQKDFDRCEEWTYMNFMRFSKGKCMVSHLGQGNAESKYRLEGNGWRAAPRKTPWGSLWMSNSTRPSLQPRNTATSWAASKAVQAAGKGRWSCPSTLLWWDPSWSPASSSGFPSTERTWICWNSNRGWAGSWSNI